MMLTAILVEDYEIARLGLRLALKRIPSIELLGECSSGEGAIEVVKELRPQVVFMDIGLPGINGLVATESIKAISPDTKVILLTSHNTERDVAAGFQSGASAYCLKDISIASLANAVNSVMDGALWVDPRISKTLVSLIGTREHAQPAERLVSPMHASKSLSRLSGRELEVLSHLVKGLTNKEMAEQMYLSQETIKTHLRHVFEKLEATDRTQAAVKALKLGLVH